MANHVGGTRMDTVVKLVLIFFISLLSFAVGTFVGKGVSDSEYREAALERGDYKNFRETASADSDSHDHHGTATKKAANDALSEEDIASLTEEFVNAEKKEMKKEVADNSPKKVEVTKDGYKRYDKGQPSKEYAKKVEKTHQQATDKKVTTAEKKTDAKATDTSQRAVASAANRVADGKSPTKNTVEKFENQIVFYQVSPPLQLENTPYKSPLMRPRMKQNHTPQT